MNDPDLQALDDIWPIGRQLAIPDGGTVVIAGAYKGRYMHYIADRFPRAREIIGFEPQKEAYFEAINRVKNYENCFVANLALGTHTELPVSMGKSGTDGCSFLSSDLPIEQVKMVEFSEALQLHKYPNIDCFICNMEGYEYHLLPHILKNKLHEKIKSMAVQFHSEVALGEQTIRASLNEYYGEPIQSPGWCYWRKQ